MIPIIALAGPAGSGKDTAARAIVDTFGFTLRRLADPIRATLALPAWQQALTVAGPDGPRRAAQAIGDAFRALDPALLVRLALTDVPAQSPGVVIPDVRLLAEAEALRQWPKAWLVFCDTDPATRAHRLRARDGRPLSAAAAQHTTEATVDAVAALADFRWANTGPFIETWPVLRAWLETIGFPPVMVG
ncbi:hypothetical protein Sulac_0466 [Sulfobacillus acidophilus DSM 10332]|uniref:Adenylate kinase n=1 Tax=Sulfobacillus acidophilus (strain ATCC 700253 / DSM 10332 / NAL) TaxID=679936 RepID=G8TYQ3_SULAD|nr:hypothetical protein Sulac_0466 [Sulfobacillus acidophilus DSM 10332]